MLRDIRYAMQQKPEIVPFFPLSVFLLPGEDVPLRIFEPRYKQLMEDVRANGITFVIPYLQGQEVQEFGSEVRLKEVLAENPGGRMVIAVQSVALVRVVNFSEKMDGKLYGGGAVLRIPCSEPVESPRLKDLIQQYTESFDHDFLSSCRNGNVTRQDVMRALNLPSDDKFRFISLRNGQEKESYLERQLRYLTMIRKQENLLGNDYGLN